MNKTVLVVDDDLISRELITEVLSSSEIRVECAGSAEEALEILRKKNIPVVLSDIRMLELTGLDLLKKVKRLYPETTVVLMTGFGSVEGALESIREGAFDYISKPFQMEDLKVLIERALRQSEILSHSQKKKEETTSYPKESLVGKSQKIVEVYRLIARAALSHSHVFISGELGTGKSLVARTIHNHSNRVGHELQLLSEGVEWGEPILSLIKGDLLIEEITELSLEKQTHLSRILDESEAGQKEIRVFSLSKYSILEIKEKNLIKPALFYRLSTISIELPALRERLEDLPELIEIFLGRHSDVSHLSQEAFQLLKAYSWPGNLRELKQLLERAIALKKGPVLEPDDFPTLIVPQQHKSSFHEVDVKPIVNEEAGNLEDLEKTHIQKALLQTDYNKSKAAEILGIDRATLYRKCKTYGIDVKSPEKKS